MEQLHRDVDAGLRRPTATVYRAGVSRRRAAESDRRGAVHRRVQIAGMLWLAYTRSARPHARIVSVDTSAAKQLLGVHAVLTGADIGDVRLGRRLLDWPALAKHRVRMVGDRVAAIAAETKAAAEEAAELVEVEYEDLPLLTIDNALDDDAPILHPDIDS
jgi:CO/xanthine dehydrogenase Mo-binding subunit